MWNFHQTSNSVVICIQNKDEQCMSHHNVHSYFLFNEKFLKIQCKVRFLACEQEQVQYFLVRLPVLIGFVIFALNANLF